MLTGLRRVTGLAKRAGVLEQKFGRVLQSKVRQVGSEYKAYKDLASEKASTRRAYSKKTHLLGEVFIKDPIRMNILSPRLMKDVEDFMEWMEFDGHMRLIKLTSDDKSLFCGGTDYKTIEYLTKEKNMAGVSDYLSKLQNFAMYMVGYNKPCIVEMGGDLFNSGAAIFFQMPWVNRPFHARAIFNEAQRNSTLLGGTSYLLSRMPTGLGKFIALTGTPLEGSDLQHLGMVTMNLELDPITMASMEEKMVHMPRFREYLTLFNLPQMKRIRDEITREDYNDRALDKELDNRLQEKPENAYNILRDTIARSMLTQHANQMEQMSQAGNWAARYKSLLDTGILHTIENRMGTVEQFVIGSVKDKQGRYHSTVTSEPGNVFSHTSDAAKVFNEPTLERILKNLSGMNSEWANKAKAKLSTVDPEVANRILKQIDFARDTDYVSSLVNEYEVAMEYLTGKAGVEEVTLNYKPRSPPRALLPIKEYYREYPDSVRMALNNTYNCDPFVSKNFGKTVRNFLNLQGIDILNPVASMDVVREVLWNRKKIKRDAELTKERNELLFGHFEKRNIYSEERREAIEDLFESERSTERINEIISEAFNKKLNDHRKFMAHRNRAAQLLLRRDNIEKLRDIINAAKVTPLVDEVHSRPMNPPLEIVDDPLAYSHDLSERYFLEERVALLQGKMDLNRANVEAYLRGEATVHDLLQVSLKDDQNHSVMSDDYFRGYYIPMNIREEYRIRQVFKHRVALLGLEDLREVSFREKYLDEQTELLTKTVEGYNSMTDSQRSDAKLSIRQMLQQEFFDYKQGVKNKFYYEDPHTTKGKVERLDARDAAMVLHYKKEGKYTFDSEVGSLNEDVLDAQIDAKKKRVGRSGPSQLIEEMIDYDRDLRRILGKFYGNYNKTHSIIGAAQKKIYDLLQSHIKKAFAESTNGPQGLPQLTGGELNNPMFEQIDSYIKTNLAHVGLERMMPVIIASFATEAISVLGTLERLSKKLKSFGEAAAPADRSADEEDDDEDVQGEFLQDQADVRQRIADLLDSHQDLNVPEDPRTFKELLGMFIKEHVQHLFEIGKEAGERIKAAEMTPAVKQAVKELKEGYDAIDWFQVSGLSSQTDYKKLSGIGLGAPTLKEIGREKMIEVLKTNPTTPGFENIIKQYGEWRALNSQGAKTIVSGPIPIIFEVEIILKRIAEGKFSGVDEDFSSLNQILQTNFLTLDDNGEAWVKTRLLEYFGTLFAIRDKFERDLNNKDLVEYDLKFAEFFTPTSLKQMLTSELERDMVAFDFLRELQKSNDAKDLEVHRLNKNPELMAFTLKHRILNTVAFRRYRSFFMMAQFIKSQTGGKKKVDLRRLKLEEEVLKVSLERLFKESQTPPEQLPTSRPFDIVEARRLRTSFNNDLESQLERYDVNLIRSLGGSEHRKVFSSAISDEMDRLKERMRIYGFN